MRDVSGTRFVDWIDYLALPDAPETERHLRENGFEVDGACARGPGARIFRNAQGVFPRVVLTGDSGVQVALKVDSVVDFLAIHQIDAPVEGEPFAPMRRAVVARAQGASLAVVERYGTWQFAPPRTD